METGRVWIDITDLAVWRGHFSGTQRVSYEIAQRFHGADEPTGFFVYDGATRKFHEASFEALKERLTRERSAAKEAACHQGQGRLRTVRSWWANALGRCRRSLASHLSPSARRQLRSALTVVMGPWGRPGRRDADSPGNLSTGRLAAFGPGDAVLVLGKPWDSDGLIEELHRLKVASGFWLGHLVFDLIPIYLPHVFNPPIPVTYRRYMREALRASDHIFAISQATSRDVARFGRDIQVAVPPVTVVRLGDEIRQVSESSAEVPGLDGQEFLLCVGTVEVRKNHILLYMAYSEALRRGIQLPRLVIVGGRGWLTGDVLYELTNDPAVSDQVLLLHDVDDDQLAWLYRACRFAVYPSTYEGWGLPIAEALACGKLCISSDAASMPEIAGDLIDYFSPYDPVQCLSTIMRYLDDEVLAAREHAIRRDYQPSNWGQTYDAVRNVVASRGLSRPRDTPPIVCPE